MPLLTGDVEYVSVLLRGSGFGGDGVDDPTEGNARWLDWRMNITGERRTRLGFRGEISLGAALRHSQDAEPDQLPIRLAWNSRRIAAIGTLCHRRGHLELFKAGPGQTIKQGYLVDSTGITDERVHGDQLAGDRILWRSSHFRNGRWQVSAIPGVCSAWSAGRFQAVFGERGRGPVIGAVAVLFRADALQGAGRAVGALWPGRAVFVFDGIHDLAGSVGEFEPLALVAKVLAENPRDRRVVELAKAFAVSANDQEPFRPDAGARGELELDPFGKSPSTQIDRLVTGIVQLDVFQVLDVVRRVVKDFVDDHASAGVEAQASQKQSEEPEFWCRHGLERVVTAPAAGPVARPQSREEGRHGMGPDPG